MFGILKRLSTGLSITQYSKRWCYFIAIYELNSDCIYDSFALGQRRFANAYKFKRVYKDIGSRDKDNIIYIGKEKIKTLVIQIAPFDFYIEII